MSARKESKKTVTLLSFHWHGQGHLPIYCDCLIRNTTDMWRRQMSMKNLNWKKGWVHIVLLLPVQILLYMVAIPTHPINGINSIIWSSTTTNWIRVLNLLLCLTIPFSKVWLLLRKPRLVFLVPKDCSSRNMIHLSQINAIVITYHNFSWTRGIEESPHISPASQHSYLCAFWRTALRSS